MEKVNNHGVALVFVLWALVILSVIAGQFAYSMRNEVVVTRLVKEESQSYFIARAGIVKAIEMMSNHEKIVETKDDMVWRVNTEIPTQSFGGGFYKISIGNDSGKVNLNYARRDLLKLLIQSAGAGEEESDSIVDAILDWRDADGLRRLNGAENDYYQSLEAPYKCRDGLFRYNDELLLIKGITKEMYFKNGLRNSISTTVLSRKRKNKKKRFHNPGRININAVPIGLLERLTGIDQESVDKIVEFRKEKDIRNFNELVQVTGPQAAGTLKNFIDYTYNRFYTFDAEGWVDNEAIRQRIHMLALEETSGEKQFRIVRWVDNI